MEKGQNERESTQVAGKLSAIANWFEFVLSTTARSRLNQHRTLVTFEVDTRQGFGKDVGGVVVGVDVFYFDVSTVDEFAYFKIAAFDVTRSHT